MKKILFIEAVRYDNYYDDRYKHIRNLGYEVFVLYGICDVESRSSKYSHAAGSRDIDAIAKAALHWHQNVCFDGITTLSETSVLATAHVAAIIGLPYASHSAAKASRDKYAMRMCHARASVNHPQFLGVSELGDLSEWPKDKYPAIVKPAMGSASAFVFKIDNQADLLKYAAVVLENHTTMAAAEKEAIGVSAPLCPVIVESFLPGSEHLVEGYVFNKKFVLGSLVDRITVEGSTFDDDVHHAPSALPSSTVSAILDTVQSAISAQGIDLAPIHAEVRFAGDVPNIVEVAIRPGGGGLNHMATLCYNYDPLEVTAQLAVGTDPMKGHATPTGLHTVAACLMGEEGTVRAISGEKGILSNRSVFFFKLLATSGSVLLRPPQGNSILGFLGVSGGDIRRRTSISQHRKSKSGGRIRGTVQSGNDQRGRQTGRIWDQL